MGITESISNNSALASLVQRAGPAVTSAIKSASQRTGVDFSYLMEKAAAESAFKTDAKAKTSSASGLYQFIESTWLTMVRDHGREYGLGEYAAKIDAGGKVADKAARNEILALRNDPKTASFMAAEFAADNQSYLARNSGLDSEDIGSTELYLAHFMGAGGASQFLKAYQENPLQTAANLFPKAALANRNVFYDSQTGNARTLAGVYDFFDRKFSGEGAAVSGTTAVASATGPKAGPSGGVMRIPAASAPETLFEGLFMSGAGAAGTALPGVTSLFSPGSGNRNENSSLNALFASMLPGAGSAAGLVSNPAEIMLMAQLDMPGETGAGERKNSRDDGDGNNSGPNK